MVLEASAGSNPATATTFWFSPTYSFALVGVRVGLEMLTYRSHDVYELRYGCINLGGVINKEEFQAKTDGVERHAKIGEVAEWSNVARC